MKTWEIVLIVTAVALLAYFLFFNKPKKTSCGCNAAIVPTPDGGRCLADSTDLAGNPIKVPGIVRNGVCEPAVVS